jgi:uncharacterized membrane protein YkgB
MAHALATQPALTRHQRKWDASLQFRVMATILGPVVWLSFTLLYVGFWARNFTVFQGVIVVLVSIMVLAGLMASLWAFWGMRQARWALGE